MPGIDYSKWDKLSCSSSSGSDNGSERDEPDTAASHHYRKNHTPANVNGGVPQVTRLEYPSRVTLGPSGVQLSSAPPKATANPFALPPMQQSGDGPTENKADAAVSANAALSCSSLGAPAAAAEGTGKDSANEEGEEDDEDLLYHSLARNGGREGQEHWWSQQDDCATVSFLLPWETTTKDVVQFRLHEVPDAASCGAHAQVDVTVHLTPHRSQTLVAPRANEEAEEAAPSSFPAVLRIRKQFRYPIKLSEELVEGCWQLHRMPRRHVRLLVVEVFKEPVGHGITLWWDRCFVSDTASVINTRQIPDRVQSGTAAGISAQEKAEQFRKVWDEAHEEFRRRMKERNAKQT